MSGEKPGSGPDGTLFVFFAAYNEGASAGNLLRRLAVACPRLAARHHVLVVDDGNDAESRRHLEPPDGLPLTCLRHDHNRGLAAAMETGLRWLAERVAPGDVVVIMDGDDTHDPEQIGAMLARIREGADVVIASRYRRGAATTGVAALRRSASRIASWGARARFRIPGTRDYTCGYRAIRAPFVSALVADGRLPFEQARRGFACAPELLLRLADAGAVVREVPLLLRYDRKQAPSSLEAGPTLIGLLALAWRGSRGPRPRAR